jgi:shikimate dehydrogenase
VTAATQVVALLGHPVAHSWSPQLHNAAFAAVGFDAVYVALDVAPDAVEAAVAGIAALGLLGANVTVPHKRAVFAAVPRRTAAAQACGAANTLYWDSGALVADNTDVEGLRGVLADDLGLTQGEDVVLFGTGGAARAAAVALGQIGARVEVVGRREAAVSEIEVVAREAGATTARVDHPRVVINATPLGMRGESLPERFMRLEPGQAALDLVYGANETPFVRAARARGARAADGRGMLLGQAAAAFARWTGVPAPRRVMADRLESLR